MLAEYLTFVWSKITPAVASLYQIMVNGTDEIFIERNGQITGSGMRFESKEKLEDVIQRIAAGCNRTVNEASPIVDARLENGSRFSSPHLPNNNPIRPHTQACPDKIPDANRSASFHIRIPSFHPHHIRNIFNLQFRIVLNRYNPFILWDICRKRV